MKAIFVLFPEISGNLLAKAISEIHAIKILYNLTATLISSGIFDVSSGDLIILVDGNKSNIDILKENMEVWK